MPRFVSREWPFPKLIALHFWLVVIGFAIYFVTLTIAGVLQGFRMLDEAQPFIESVRVTLPWLQGRSIGGLLLTLGHLVFAAPFVELAPGLGPARSGDGKRGVEGKRVVVRENVGGRCIVNKK